MTNCILRLGTWRLEGLAIRCKLKGLGMDQEKVHYSETLLLLVMPGLLQDIARMSFDSGLQNQACLVGRRWGKMIGNRRGLPRGQ